MAKKTPAKTKRSPPINMLKSYLSGEISFYSVDSLYGCLSFYSVDVNSNIYWHNSIKLLFFDINFLKSWKLSVFSLSLRYILILCDNLLH